MKKNYVIEHTSDGYMIKETKTDQYLFSYDHKMPAYALCNKLNKGSGFEGETPAFFTQKYILDQSQESTLQLINSCSEAAIG